MSVLILCALALGIIPAAIAHRRGRSFLLWWLFGAALFIVALPIALTLVPDTNALDGQMARSGYRKCPWCAEMIRNEAIVCKHCARALVPRTQYWYARLLAERDEVTMAPAPERCSTSASPRLPTWACRSWRARRVSFSRRCDGSTDRRWRRAPTAREPIRVWRRETCRAHLRRSAPPRRRPTRRAPTPHQRPHGLAFTGSRAPRRPAHPAPPDQARRVCRARSTHRPALRPALSRCSRRAGRRRCGTRGCGHPTAAR